MVAMLNFGEGKEHETLKRIDIMDLHNLIIEAKGYLYRGFQC